jgi:hypothetical protein
LNTFSTARLCSRASSTTAGSLQSTMPNGGSHFRSALQRRPPSMCHSSDEEWVQEAKQAWPRPRILALWTMRAWQTFINRSHIAETLALHRVIPQVLLAHYPLIPGHLAEFLARRGHRCVQCTRRSFVRGSADETTECSACRRRRLTP